MRCDQCRHWDKAPDEYEVDDVPEGNHACLAIKDFILHKFKGEGDHRAVVHNGYDVYESHLFTAPEFFCALFEEITRGQSKSD